MREWSLETLVARRRLGGFLTRPRHNRPSDSSSMKGDACFADVVKALTGRLDPDNFELCVADILRDD